MGYNTSAVLRRNSIDEKMLQVKQRNTNGSKTLFIDVRGETLFFSRTDTEFRLSRSNRIRCSPIIVPLRAVPI